MPDTLFCKKDRIGTTGGSGGNMGKRRLKKCWANIGIIIAAGVFLASTGKIVWTLAEQNKEEKAFEQLADEVQAARDAAAGAGDGAGQDSTSGTGDGSGQTDASGQTGASGAGDASGQDSTPGAGGTGGAATGRTVMQKDADTGILLPYLSLYQKNNDLFGWISIEGTRIDYPVMYTPSDPEYYLRRAFDGSEANSGTPFLDADCSEEGGLYIVYAHRMKNKTMFGTLPEYAKKEYWEKHPVIDFDTLYEQGSYEVVAAFYSRIYGEGEEGFRYYAYKNLSAETIFDEFKAGVEKEALYDTGKTLSYGDTVLLLSTCSYHADDGRFVVVAKKRTATR